MTIGLSSIEKSEHDAVIRALSKELMNKTETNVKTNPSESKDNPVELNGKRCYPDVFTHKGNALEEIYEVETESNVSDQSASQWKAYSLPTVKFFLVVPKSKLEEAKKIAKANNIRVDGYWTFGI